MDRGNIELVHKAFPILRGERHNYLTNLRQLVTSPSAVKDPQGKMVNTLHRYYKSNTFSTNGTVLRHHVVDSTCRKGGGGSKKRAKEIRNALPVSVQKYYYSISQNLKHYSAQALAKQALAADKQGILGPDPSTNLATGITSVDPGEVCTGGAFHLPANESKPGRQVCR
jgi:hypothetical protein